ncbi:flavin reductase family protein [Enterovibrio sp. ZSDZ35]|uniref:Flavin reductase family protein n=1 Tax=Enterovibrio qingdaonensis TaxID=2899818 RepID=A0ABT5QGU4_9GAMM|nr:flavin reductase family protein [Enterovibrio sp. ZSDZ35]MDD1780191.1 flavin reductase family protein [Enterovibrio sp. ZSDZ35]
MSRELRNALSCFATGVTVITTRHQGQDYGLTCSSFNSVSLEPAIVLWSINSTSSSKAPILESGGYTVSVLAAEHSELAMKFCNNSHEERFRDVAISRAPSGRAVIDGAVAWFDCDLNGVIAAGDHDILLGKVTEFSSQQNSDGLVFARSRFGRFGEVA